MLTRRVSTGGVDGLEPTRCGCALVPGHQLAHASSARTVVRQIRLIEQPMTLNEANSNHQVNVCFRCVPGTSGLTGFHPQLPLLRFSR
jgi:hypothetical protein